MPKSSLHSMRAKKQHAQPNKVLGLPGPSSPSTKILGSTTPVQRVGLEHQQL